MQYRIYLIGRNDRIRAGESFIAKSDLEASEIAKALYGCCSTSFDSAELWRGTERISRFVSSNVRATTELQEIIDKREENIAQLEEMLERSFECVRQSQQLMTALQKIRAGG